MLYTHHSLLLTPGPTPIPVNIQTSMNAPMVGHRSSDFQDIAQSAFQNLKPIFGTNNDVMILTSSGTSALEASMVNLVEKDDHIVVIVSGAFGLRFQKIAETYFDNVHVINIEWGHTFDVEAVVNTIKQLNVSITAVFTQYCETSTGVLHPVAELGRALHRYDDAIYFVVDGVSCIGAVDVDMARDHIDVLVSGSQKALMLPPGIAFVAYNDRAKTRFKAVQTPRFYLDLNQYLNAQQQNSTPFTPNVSAFRGVNAYCQMIQEEGFDQVIQRHQQIQRAVRKALVALDLRLLTEDTYASPTVTAFIPNNEDECAHIKSKLKSDFNIVIAGGQGKLKNYILRVGHMGFISPFDLLPFFASLEMILTEYRQPQYIGVATKVFMEVLHNDI